LEAQSGDADKFPNLRAIVLKEAWEMELDVPEDQHPTLGRDMLDTLRTFEEHSILVDVQKADQPQGLWIPARILTNMRTCMEQNELIGFCRYALDSQIHCENVRRKVYLGRDPLPRIRLDLREADTDQLSHLLTAVDSYNFQQNGISQLDLQISLFRDAKPQTVSHLHLITRLLDIDLTIHDSEVCAFDREVMTAGLRASAELQILKIRVKHDLHRETRKEFTYVEFPFSANIINLPRLADHFAD